jgi:hypothetical protein
MTVPYTIGLSLGQLGSGEPSALAIVHRREDDHMTVVHLERFEPPTSTGGIAARLAETIGRKPLHRHEWKYRENPYHPGAAVRERVEHYAGVAVDATGSSAAELATIREALSGKADMRTIVLTNGAAGPGQVPRRDIAGLLRTYLERGALAWPASLTHAGLLAKELRRFKAKIPAGRTDADRAFRENDNDDLVLAVGVALYVARRRGPAIDLELVAWMLERGMFGGR